MRIGMSAEIRSNSFLAGLVQLGNRTLEAVIGPCADEVEASWAFCKGAGEKSCLQVTLEDYHGACDAGFALDEFTDADRLRGRCEELWDELLDQGPKSAMFPPRPALRGRT